MPDTTTAGGAGDTNVQPEKPEGDGQGLTFEAWVAGQDASVRSMLDSHTSGLKSALTSERDARAKLEKQLKDMAKSVEKGSELEKQLNDLITQHQQAQSQAEFYEAAHAQGVKNLKLAYVVATTDELVDSKGRVNFDEMKKRYPELFGGLPGKPAGNAGTGTSEKLTPNHSMNAYIRAAAGRK